MLMICLGDFDHEFFYLLAVPGHIVEGHSMEGFIRGLLQGWMPGDPYEWSEIKSSLSFQYIWSLIDFDRLASNGHVIDIEFNVLDHILFFEINLFYEQLPLEGFFLGLILIY